jgi:hypothetical protein
MERDVITAMVKKDSAKLLSVGHPDAGSSIPRRDRDAQEFRRRH